MTEIDKLFFELIRIAIGKQDGLSQLPSNKEWRVLYDMAKKQSLVGVCFAALQRLGADTNDGYTRIGMSEMLYLTWMGMAAKIQQRNQIVDEQCVVLQKRLSADGLRSSVLKGQGVASLYSKHLLGLRQTGDIDILLDCGLDDAVRYIKDKGLSINRWDYKHLDIDVFDDTEVELHYRPGIMQNLLRNRRLQRFWVENKNEFYQNNVSVGQGSIILPSNRMNAFFLVLHIYGHLFSGGIGLRQVMDLYFSILSLDGDEEWLDDCIDSFGMKSFMEALIWILREVFGLDASNLSWTPNQREGEFLLSEIMEGGNFGKHDNRFVKNDGTHMSFLKSMIRKNMHLLRHYSGEVIWSPVYYAWHWVWKRIHCFEN